MYKRVESIQANRIFCVRSHVQRAEFALESLESDLQTLQQENDYLRTQRDELRATIATFPQHEDLANSHTAADLATQLQAARDAADSEIQSVREMAAADLATQLQAARDAADSEIQSVREMAAADLATRLQAARDAADSEIQSVREMAAADLATQLQSVRSTSSASTTDLLQLQESSRILLSEVQTELMAARGECTTLKAANAVLSENAALAEQRATTASEEIASITLELHALQASAEQHSSALRNLQAALVESQLRASLAAAEASELRTAHIELQSALAAATGQIATLSATNRDMSNEVEAKIRAMELQTTLLCQLEGLVAAKTQDIARLQSLIATNQDVDGRSAVSAESNAAGSKLAFGSSTSNSCNAVSATVQKVSPPLSTAVSTQPGGPSAWAKGIIAAQGDKPLRGFFC
jgi:chromosome segregation ATPase